MRSLCVPEGVVVNSSGEALDFDQVLASSQVELELSGDLSPSRVQTNTCNLAGID